MLNLKLAELYADLVIRTNRYDATMRKIKADIASAQQFKVTFNVDTTQLASAAARLNAFKGLLDNLNLSLQVRTGGVGGGAGGMGRSSALAGLAAGAGLPYGSPQMMAGYAASRLTDDTLRTFADVQAGMNEIRRKAGLSLVAVAALKHELIEVSRTQPGVAVKDMLEIADVGASAGVDRSNLGAFARDIALVKNSIADMPTDELATKFVRTLTTFDLGTDKVRGFGSALAAMDNISTGTARDLLDLSNRLSGVAHSIGMTLPEVLALASALKDSGLTNEVAGTAGSQILSRLATKREGMAAALGVDLKSLTDLYRQSPILAMGAVARRIGEMPDTVGKQELVEELGLKGERVKSVMLQLANVIDRLPDRIARSNNEFKTMSALIENNNIKTGSYWQTVQNLENTWTKLKETIGEGLAPGAEGAMKFFASQLDIANSALLNTVRRLEYLRSGQLWKDLWNGAPPPVKPPAAMPKMIIGGKPIAFPDMSDPDWAQKMIAANKAAAAAPSLKDPNFGFDPENWQTRALGFLKNRAGAAAGMGQFFGKQILGQGGGAFDNFMDDLARRRKQKPPSYSTYSGGAELSAHLTQAILNDAAEKESLKELQKHTGSLAGILTSLQELKNQVARAALGQ